MAAAPPPPPPLMAHREGGDAPVSLFLDTDLGTHLALLVAPDTAVRGLKSQVAAEHAAAFPDLGPVTVKSFQVRRKGILYHLSDSMTVMSVFTKIKGGCFLHVNMAEATAATHCCQDAPATDDRRVSDVCLGIHVKNHVEELPVMAPDVACDMLSRGLQGGNVDAALNNVQAHDALPNCTLVPSSSQLNTEILKNKEVGLASGTKAGIVQVIDKAKSYNGQIKHANQTEGAYISSTSMACVDKSSNESNMSHAVEELHASRDHGVGDDVSDKKQVRVEEQLLEEIQAKDTVSQAKEHKKSRTGSFDTSCTALLETGTISLVESLNISNHQEVHDTFNEESIQLENPSTVGKKKKRKRRQLSPSKSASAQETTEPSATTVDLLKPTGEVLPHNSLGIQIHNIHPMDNLSQEKEHKKSRTSSPDTSSRHLLETDPTSLKEPLNTSNHQVHDTLHQESIQLENPSAAGKKKKKKKRQLAPSKSAYAQTTTEQSSGAAPADLSKSTGDEAYNVELTGKDETIFKESGLPLSSSELNDGNQGGKSVQFVTDAQASTDLISEQERFDHALKGCMDPSIADAIYSTGENVAIEGKTTKGSCAPLDGGDKHEEIKQHNEGCHNEGVPETSNMEKDGKSTDVSDKRQTNQNTSQVKKRKKSKVGSVGMPSVDATGEKDHGYSENAAKQDTVSTKREIVHEPSMQQMPNIVYQGDSNVIENPSGDGKKKKKRRRHSESLKGMSPSQDLTKSSGFVTNEDSIQCTDAAPIDAKQTTQGIVEGEIVTEHKKLSESLDVAATNVIVEALADLRSKDSLSKDLDEDLLPGQTHLGSNQNGLEVPESIAVKVGSVTAALPPKYPAAVHSASPVSSPRQKKSKGKKSKVLATMTDSSHQSSGVPEKDANRELKESDSLRFADKTSGPEDIVTGNVVVQADDKRKATKRQRKKGSVKQVLDTLDLKEANDTEENLVQGGSVVDTPLSTVGKVEQKDRSSETLTPKKRETNCSTHGLDSHAAKDNQDEYVTDIIGTHDNENAAGTPTLHVVQKDAMSLKSANPNSQKERKTSSNSELQSQGCALEHGFSADLVNARTEKGVSTTSSASAVKPDYHTVFHPANDGINFLDHFSCSNMNDGPSIAAESKQNNEDESLREVKNKKKKKRKQGTGSIEPNNVLESLPSEKASLTGHFGTSKAIVPSVASENINGENVNVNNGKEKKRKGKANMEVATAEKDNPNCDNQGIDIGTQESLISIVQKERTGQDNGKEGNNKVTQNASIMQHEPEDATWNHTPEKSLHQSVDDDQNKLLTEKDHAHVSKDVRKFTSQTKPHAKIRKPDGSTIKGKVAPNPEPVSNLVKDFSMSPRASSDSTEGTPQSANPNRYRVAVRKVPSKRYEETSGNSKKASRKVGSGAIFNDSISEGSGDELDTKTVMEGSPDSSSTSADSGISSAAYDESEVPDDDGTVSLSQKSLKGGLHIGSILRGSRSYQKARKKQAELLDDDTIVPDSQPTDGLWG